MPVLSYLIYPMWLRNQAQGKTIQIQYSTLQEKLPPVSIVIPICNEEKIIADKLNSILQTNFPKENISIFLGLDHCTDATKFIIESQFNFPNIHIIEFKERTGKPSVLNQIIEQHITDDECILILTDANVIFTDSTIFELIKYFKEEKTGLVDANIQTNVVKNKMEDAYWNYETEIKTNESIVYRKILGPSGGCYAIRKKLFTPVPAKFLVDDFFIGFNIVIQDYHALLNTQAICFEDINTNWKQEFKRKVRIASGNFQNLWYFKKYAFNWFSDIGFMFLVHKVIRWKTPFFLLMLYYILLLEFTLIVLIVTLFLPLIDVLLFTFGVEFKPLRRFHYFIVMNIAVFIGFVNFCKGIKSNVWQPTTRN